MYYNIQYIPVTWGGGHVVPGAPGAAGFCGKAQVLRLGKHVTTSPTYSYL